VVAKVDWETPKFLRDYVVAAASPQEALAVIDGLRETDRLAEQSARSVALADLFSWNSIADRYVEAMERLVSRGARSDRLPEPVSGMPTTGRNLKLGA
jgi:hypothetical protein